MAIQYRAGYKYQLAETYTHVTMIYPSVVVPGAVGLEVNEVKTDFIFLDHVSNLTIKAGYAWDGPSGPVRDTHRNLRASLIHDAFYQLMRLGKLPRDPYKALADTLFYTMCRADGVFGPLAWLYLQGLRRFGNPATDPGNARKVQYAPWVVT